MLIYLLRSYSSREPFSKSECANIVQATEKVEVPLDSLVNGLKDSLSDKNCYDHIKGLKIKFFQKRPNFVLSKNAQKHKI